MEERKEEHPGLPPHAQTSDLHPLSQSAAPSDESNVHFDHRSLNTPEASSGRPPAVHSVAKPPPIPALPSSFQRSSGLPADSALSHESGPEAGPSSVSAPVPRSASLSSIFPQALSEVPASQQDEIGGSRVISHPLMFEGPANQGEEQALSPQSLSRHSSYRSRSPSLGPSSPTASASSSTGVPGNYSSRVSSRSPSFSKDIVAEATHFPERRGSLFPFRKVSVQDVSSDIGSLQKLARQGSWRAIIEKVKETRKRDIVHSLDEQLSYTSYHVLALMKLRNYGAAADELAALGDLDSSKFRYEDNPSLQSEKSGSMVPFGLRWLHAILPRWLGEIAKATDRLYELLAHCNKRIDHLEEYLKRTGDYVAESPPELDLLTGLSVAERPVETGTVPLYSTDEGEQVRSNSFTPNDAAEDDLGTVVSSAAIAHSPAGCQLMIEKWRRRQEMVLHTALAHHLNDKEFLVALTLLENLLKSRSSDPVLLSRYGYVQLLVGDIDGAKSTFSAVETEVAKQGISHGLLANLVGRNRGLLLFALKQYSAASKKFDAVLKQDPGDEIAANNKALCLMYSRDLVGATQVLEDVLQRSPLTALYEPLVLNLCSMYELSSMNSTEAKRTLSSWIMRIAPDDFDMTCTRL